MNRKLFLQQLRMQLHGLSKEEIETIITDYERFFVEAATNGMKDEEVMQQLGNPLEIARALKQERRPQHVYVSNGTRSAGGQLLIGIGLILFNLIFVLGPGLGFAGALAGCFIAFLAFMVSPIIALFSIMLGNGPLLDFFVSLIFSGIAIILFPYYITFLRMLGNLFTRYIHWNAAQWKGVEKGV